MYKNKKIICRLSRRIDSDPEYHLKMFTTVWQTLEIKVSSIPGYQVQGFVTTFHKLPSLLELRKHNWFNSFS